MKNKLRKIVVLDKTYIWSVVNPDCDGDGGCRVKIWKDKKLIHETIIHTEIITPKVIKEKILSIIQENTAFDMSEPCYCSSCERTYKNYERFCIHLKKCYAL